MPRRIRWGRGSSWACRSDPMPPPREIPETDGAAASTAEREITIHASCVAHDGRAVLIRGASGSGKSGLAVQLIALGARLVADDRTRLWPEKGRVVADVPDTIRGRIEVRGVGILSAPPAGPQPLALVVDMDRLEQKRLPPPRRTSLAGVSLPLIGKSDAPHFPAAILLYLSGERIY